MQKLIKQLTDAGYTFTGQGTKRAVYLSPCGKHVVKIPIDPLGVMDNNLEYMKYKSDKTGTLARCMIAKEGLLIMETVKSLDLFCISRRSSSPVSLPEWASEYDYQIGFNSKNKLVAYDYA